jgi:hypothetical protein
MSRCAKAEEVGMAIAADAARTGPGGGTRLVPLAVLATVGTRGFERLRECRLDCELFSTEDDEDDGGETDFVGLVGHVWCRRGVGHDESSRPLRIRDEDKNCKK